MKIYEVVRKPTQIIANNDEIFALMESIKDYTMPERFNFLESYASNNSNTSLSDNVEKIQQLLNAYSSRKVKIGKKYIPVMINAFRSSILFSDVNRNISAQSLAKFGILTNETSDAVYIKIDGKEIEFPSPNLVKMFYHGTVLIESVEKYERFRTHVALVFDVHMPEFDYDTLNEASGYIPSEKEKNDPRFKSALSCDVRPQTMQNNAKRFGNKLSRSGIPPTAKSNGKF